MSPYLSSDMLPEASCAVIPSLSRGFPSQVFSPSRDVGEMAATPDPQEPKGPHMMYADYLVSRSSGKAAVCAAAYFLCCTSRRPSKCIATSAVLRVRVFCDLKCRLGHLPLSAIKRSRTSSPPRSISFATRLVRELRRSSRSPCWATSRAPTRTSSPETCQPVGCSS